MDAGFIQDPAIPFIKTSLDRCDVIILPGSKLVGEDLHYMEKYGIASKLIALQPRYHYNQATVQFSPVHGP